VAEVDGRVIGMVVGWMLIDEMHIATIATHPDYRRQGIGSKLLLYTLLKSIDEGAKSSFLEVRESNLAAQEMYLKFGYERMGRRKRYYRDNDEDAILMYLQSLSRDRLPRDDGPAMDTEQK
jgi:ribosomal-protein-alanine N-acetyltransferase